MTESKTTTMLKAYAFAAIWGAIFGSAFSLGMFAVTWMHNHV